MTAPLIINIGFARCGTTAAHHFFKAAQGVATPVPRKELNYWVKGTDWDEYKSKFTDDGELMFEASPKYAQRGPEHLAEVIDNVRAAVPADRRVIFLLLLRNPMKRAFSHYWHNISSHYAIFGKLWRVNRLDDPERLKALFQRSFEQELRHGDDMLVDVEGVMRTLLDKAGADDVRVGFNGKLDACLSDLLRTDCGWDAGELPVSPRISGAASPLYLRGGASGTTHEVRGPDGTVEVEVPAGQVLLLSRRVIELFPEDRFDIGAMEAAAENWSHRVDVPSLDLDVEGYLSRQAEALENVPETCFLADCKEELIADVRAVPAELSIGRRTWSPDALSKALGADRVKPVAAE